jgi:hypothetical protein
VKRLSVLIAVLGAAVFTSAALAASAHWVTGPTLTVSGNSITITGKAAGLGNTVGFADFSLTGTVNVSSRCYTKSGNKPQAANKQESITVDQNGSFAVKNGTVTPIFTISPLSTLTCPGGQHVVIESISYDLTLSSADFPALNTTFTSP